MKLFHELALTKGYWLTKIQSELFSCVEEYLEKNNLTRTQFAEQLQVSKGYISQVLNGDFDHRLSKLIELALAVGVVPNFKFQNPEDYIDNYLSGYDFCINEANCNITLTVNNNSIPLSSDNSNDFSSSLLFDEENTISYSVNSESQYIF